jgi:hypothetical protein
MDRPEEKMNMEKHHLPRDVAEPTVSIDESRRRFTKSSLVASGVLLTLASRPSLGGGGGFVGGHVCKTPSGFLSANLSHHGTQCTCSGRTPGYWGTNTDSSHKWPSPYTTGSCSNTQYTQKWDSWSGNGTMYNDSFLGFHCYNHGSIYKSYTMLQTILLGGTGDPSQLGAHCVAAILNARMGWTPVLTETQIRNMFNEWDMHGYYTPTAGVKWYAADIVTYLKSTMPL